MSASAGALPIQFRVDFLRQGIVEHLVEGIVFQAETVEDNFQRFFLRLFIQRAVSSYASTGVSSLDS